MTTGTVKFVNNERGFGFITPADGQKDVYVHASNVVGDGFRLSRKASPWSSTWQRAARDRRLRTSGRSRTL